MRLLDGKPIAQAIRAQVTADAARYREAGIAPALAIVVATADAQAAWYVRSICKAAAACGVEAKVIELGPDATTDVIASALKTTANDSSVHGIILQTPLPSGVAVDDLLSLIPLAKDVDGASPASAGQLLYGLAAFVPATDEACV